MQNLYPDIFNDVFGPIMQPGSSSHTAGPCRIGYLAHCFLGEPLQRITVILDKNGSFAGTFGHMNEDIGMLAGASGMLPNNPEMFEIKEILHERGILYEFCFDEIEESRHANAVKFILTDKSGGTVTLVGNSTGGGMVEIVSVNDFPVLYHGESHVAFVEIPRKEAGVNALKELQKNETVMQSRILKRAGCDQWALWVETSEKFDGTELQELIKEKEPVHFFSPVLPVPNSFARKAQLFDSVTDWIRLAEEQEKSLFDLAILYEQSASGWSKEKIILTMEEIAAVMERQVSSVYERKTDLLETPFSGYHFQQWEDYQKQNGVQGDSIFGAALKYAFGAQTMSKGIPIVPGPMGNGGAYIYSVLKAVKEQYQLSNTDLIRGLFIAGIIGVICYTRTEPTGEIIGCTGECGMCSAMAAAGVVEMRHGTPEQVEAAASLTLQATIGWPCDPIPGGFNQPCTSRVVAAVTLAITFADVALSGRDAVLPFHEVADTADRIGRALPDELKCTSKGGLCASPTGVSCRENFEQWYGKNQEKRQ